MKTFYLVLAISFLFVVASQKMLALCEEEGSESLKNQMIMLQIRANMYQENYLIAEKGLRERGLL